jgi:hypothetical protein
MHITKTPMAHGKFKCLKNTDIQAVRSVSVLKLSWSLKAITYFWGISYHHTKLSFFLPSGYILARSKVNYSTCLKADIHSDSILTWPVTRDFFALRSTV